jgi:hypothetical protein
MKSPFNVRTPELVSFVALQAEYNDFIWNIAVSAPLSGYNTEADLPELSDEEFTLVLRAKPELLRQALPATLRQIFADVQSKCDERALEAEQVLGDLTARERFEESLVKVRS